MAYLVIKFIIDAQHLQQDLDKENGFLSRQTYHSICHSKINSLLHPPWSSNRAIRKSKYIGLIIGQDLRWKSHGNNVCAEVNKTLSFLCWNIYRSSSSVKEQAYKSLVRPSLEYALDPYKGEIDQLGNGLTHDCNVRHQQTVKCI